ncbi:MAG: YybH family protein [Gemmatimonadales bacterium]
MRHRVPVILGVTAALACQPQSEEVTEGQRTAIASAVNQRVAELFEAMNSHDVERVMSFYLKRVDFAYVGVSDVRVGWEPFSRVAALWYRTHPEVPFEHEVVHTQVLSPTVAVAVVRGSSTETELLVWTQVFVKDEGGEWVIAHEHEAWHETSEPPRPHPMAVSQAR